MRILIAIAVIMGALVAGKIYLFDGEGSEDKKQSSAPAESQGDNRLPVDVYVAEEVSTSNTIYSSGTVVPNEEVTLRSEVSGRLIHLDIREGSFVKEGQLIAKLDDSELQASLKKLEFEEELAGQIEARQQKLLDINAISKEEYDLAMNEVNTLSVDKELVLVQIGKTEVRAPFSGRIGFKNISEGAYVTPNDVIANIVQMHPVKIDFSVPEKYASQLSSGHEVTFEVDGTDDVFQAKVAALDPVIDEDLRTLKVRALTDNSLGMLLPGMFVRVTVPLENHRSIMVPTESVIPVLKGKKVFVVKGGRATDAMIRTGVRTERSVQVLEGLEVGDSIIVSALMSVKPNMEVKVNSLVDYNAGP